MATYTELNELRRNGELKNKISVAVMIAADEIRTETPPPNSAQRLAWAVTALEDPTSEAERMIAAVLAANKSATVNAITTAADSVIQTQVDAVVDLFAGS